MIPRIKTLLPLDNYKLFVEFDDGRRVNYDLTNDIATLPNYSMLVDVEGLFRHANLDSSRTVVYWNEFVDLPSDAIYEYGEKV